MQHPQRKELKERVKKITLLLERKYGTPKAREEVDPLDVLIQTILSQNTNDRNRDRAFQRLKRRFPHWDDVLEARAETVIEALRPGGLAKQKARRIRDILRWIRMRYATLSLVPLQRMSSEEVKETVGKLKGVGPKTLHCLLLFGLKREAFPVDTHVLRIGKRLGFIPEKLSAEEAHRWMVPLIPKEKSLSLHLNLIRFGRTLCKARNPQCSSCFLTAVCPDPR